MSTPLLEIFDGNSTQITTTDHPKFDPGRLPADILTPILDKLKDRKSWHTCALVNWAFNRAATPLLYRKLDSRVRKTLLKRPDLAQYVRHITETGAIHGTLHPQNLDITDQALAALKLCANLVTFTWVDDKFTSDAILLDFLSVVRSLGVKGLTIRTFSDLGEVFWAQVKTISGLERVAIWCMEGPPRVLQGWSESLGRTLKRCAGVPATILISVFSHLPLLQNLRLKGAPSSALPMILSLLPELTTLDTEYTSSSTSSSHRLPAKPLPSLRDLTIRTSTLDTLGPQQLWYWIRLLLPRPSLQTFTLHAFSVHGLTTIPRHFLLDLAKTQSGVMKRFWVEGAEMTLSDIECLCSMFPVLEELGCSVASQSSTAIKHALANAHCLMTIRLQVYWIPSDQNKRFTLQDAEDLMIVDGKIRSRVISVDSMVFEGRWVLRDVDGKKTVSFEVFENSASIRWPS